MFSVWWLYMNLQVKYCNNIELPSSEKSIWPDTDRPTMRHARMRPHGGWLW
jgi:hypothetical protein